MKVGGTANDDGKQYVLLFVHEDPVEGNCYLAVVGRNTAGFTITFAADSATVMPFAAAITLIWSIVSACFDFVRTISRCKFLYASSLMFAPAAAAFRS